MEANPGRTTVTPEVLSELARRIKELNPGLNPAQEALSRVFVRAGKFPDGDHFQSSVNSVSGSANGRAAVYLEATSQLSSALTTLAEQLNRVAADYAGTEDVNEIVATDIEEMVRAVMPQLPGPVDFGSPTPSGSPGPTTEPEEVGAPTDTGSSTPVVRV